ncbi:MAG: hypothetical protein HY078_12625 [Elusimicrobia bacterium]|nr:hypothetical protein [Elusimicrobiota bacterium]
MFPRETEAKLQTLLKPEEIAVLWKTHQRAELRQYFFRTKTDLKWFKPLKEIGYFDPAQVPLPIEDENHAFSIPQWVVLPYLESIAKSLETLGSEERAWLVRELLEIMRSVTRARREELARDGKSLRLDNLRTWYHFTKILLTFRNVEIPQDILDSLPIWLTTRFSNLAGSDLATKLLPKLLGKTGDTAEPRKAEAVARALTALTWVPLSKQRKPHGEKEEARLPLDAYWLLESFVVQKNGVHLGEACSKEFILEIAEKLHQAIGREQPRTVHLEIGDADNELLLQITQPAQGRLHCELGTAKKAEHWLTFDWAAFKTQAVFDVEASDPAMRSAAIAAEVEKLAPKERAGALKEQVAQIVTGLHHDFSYIWHRSISSTETRSVDSPRELLILILRELLVGHLKSRPADISTLLSELTSTRFEFAVFTRIALYIVGKSWRALSPHFWRLSDEKPLFDDPHYETEVFQLLRENVGSFTPEERMRIHDIIDAGPRNVLEEDRERRVTLWKQKWFSSLKADPEFLRLYDACREASQVEVTPHFFEPEIRVGPGKTPLTAEQIGKVSDKELLEFVPSFESRGRQSWDDPTPEALGLSFKGAALADPNRFAKGIAAFGALGYRYSYEILSGILDRVKKDPAAIEWSSFLAGLKALYSREEFWTDALPYKSQDRYGAGHAWVVGMAAEVIQAGTLSKGDLPKEFEQESESLLGVAVSRLVPVNDKESVRDPVSRSLNSAAGKTIEALLELSLRAARANQKLGKPRWPSSLREKMEQALKRPFIEAHEMFGRFLGHFYWLDKEWTTSRVREYDSQDDIFSYAFLVGYLHCDLFDDLFPVMVRQYRKALVVAFDDDRSVEGFVDHISMAYLREYPHQSLGDPESLITVVVRSGNVVLIRKLTGVLWMKRPGRPQPKPRKAVVVEVKDGKPQPKVIEQETRAIEEGGAIPTLGQKIIELWKFILPFYAKKEPKTDSDKGVLAELVKLTAFIPELNDEAAAMIKTSAEYVDLGFTSSFLLGYLTELMPIGDVKQNAVFIADILLAMLRHATPDFRTEDIQALVEFLLINGDATTKGKAREICDIYAKRGRAEILRDIYDKYCVEGK